MVEHFRFDYHRGTTKKDGQKVEAGFMTVKRGDSTPITITVPELHPFKRSTVTIRTSGVKLTI